LLGGVVRGWHGTPLALALEATAVGTWVVVLAVSVVDRRCAMPVAWVVLPAKTQHAWRREWRRLLRRLRPAIPRHWQVSVWTARGLSAPWLCWRMVRLGWPPFVRIKTGGTFRPVGTRGFRPVQSFGPKPGRRWRGRGTACQKAGRQVECPLVALWEEGSKAPWLMLTDLPPEASAAGWYGLRAWIAQGFKITKRAGWQWHRTRMRAPERAARRWLAVAVATLWLLRVGGVAEDDIPESTVLAVTALCPGRPRTRRAPRLRLVSVFRHGWVALLVALLRQEPLPEGHFVPEPWPAVPAGADETCEPQMPLPKAA
jgi:hypothetical protein